MEEPRTGPAPAAPEDSNDNFAEIEAVDLPGVGRVAAFATGATSPQPVELPYARTAEADVRPEIGQRCSRFDGGERDQGEPNTRRIDAAAQGSRDIGNLRQVPGTYRDKDRQDDRNAALIELMFAAKALAEDRVRGFCGTKTVEGECWPEYSRCSECSRCAPLKGEITYHSMCATERVLRALRALELSTEKQAKEEAGEREGHGAEEGMPRRNVPLEAVAKVLARIKADPKMAYFFAPASPSMALLTAAYCELTGTELEIFREQFYRQMRFERPLCAECGKAGAR